MKTIGKNLLNAAGIAGLLALAGLLFASCSSPFQPAPKPALEQSPEQTQEPAPKQEAPEGHVRISIAPDAAVRTMLPSVMQLYFTLKFDNGDGGITTETLGGALQKTVALLPGTYTLAALGYNSPYEAENGGTPVASGSPAGSFTVGTGTNDDVQVTLTAAQSGTGTLRYTLTYPANPTVSGGRIYVEQLGGPYTKLIIPSLNTGSTIETNIRTSTGTILGLASGFYQVSVYLSNGRTAIKSDLTHIYDGLETDANFVFDLSSFADVADLSPLNTAISAAKTAAAADVRISADGTGISAGHTWVSQADLDTLNAAIAAAETITANYGAGLTNPAVNAAATALNAAVLAFNSACTVGGTYTPGANIGLYVGASPNTELAAGTTLASALAWLKINAASGTSYTVLLGDDETLPPWTLGGYGSGTNVTLNNLTGVTLTLKGDAAERVVQLSGQGSLFTVNSGVTLILDQNITLWGRSDNNASLMQVSSNGILKMNAGAKITGNTASYSGGGVSISSGTFTMTGGEISGNTASSGGGVYVASGTVTIISGEISNNTASSGGGVYVASGTFTMSGGEINRNTTTALSSESRGGGVYVSGGAFTMSGGKISGNIVSSSSSISAIPSSGNGGGVYVISGTFTISDGEISGNTASSGGGVYVNYQGNISGTFVMSGNGRITQDNPVYLGSNTVVGGNATAITINNALSGTGPVAFIEITADPAWIGREVIKKSASFTGTLPADRFGFNGPWEADSNGKLWPKASSLGFGETRSAFINQGGIHFYRFTPAFNKRYTITSTTPSYNSSYLYVSAAWADGSGILVNRNSYSYNSTTPSFIANKTGVDIIIMVDCGSYSGVYSVKYNELD
jgi:hypothetical protein